MKTILIFFVFAISLSCNGSIKEKANKKNSQNTEKYVIVNALKSETVNPPTITSITFTNGEIIGDNHYGFKYDFTINIDNSKNLDILNFCKANFATILKNRVTDVKVIESILKKLDNGEIDIDETPKTLRIGSSTEDFDTVSVEIYLKKNNLLKMDLKYYSPL